MNNFSLYTPTKIVFGANSHLQIGDLLKDVSQIVLIHYGSPRIVHSGLLLAVTDALTKAGIKYLTLGGVVPNPRIDLVYQGIKICVEAKVDHILAIGGGSVLDSAKAIALGAKITDDVWDYYYIQRHTPRACLKVSAILTIPAAGSENSSSSVITNPATKQKIGYQNDAIRPYISIINPEFFYTLPKADFSAGVFDMMSHIFERYFSNTTNNDVIDGISEAVLRSIMRNALIVNKDYTNYAAWSEIALGSTLAHNGLLGAGRVTDWASHQIEHELSAMFDIAHGLGLSIITPAWMKYVYPTNKKIFINFATKIMGLKAHKNESEDQLILRAILKLENFSKKLGLKTRLREVNIPPSSFGQLAKAATTEFGLKTRTLGGLKILNEEDILKILNLAY
ncbi:MAG: iron-containing alcohol dehydrogenase [Acholeplasmatales bacterium]|jgi:alcohol dehydrogenase YqhD (iron-dependent ADH family)|nr:iron-containing alcohol dehydrogenase [Acholeplasmatales bacterium]